ncbi:hypothetical protein [Marinicellulosiphila megalodicopiae]|uniref:hypothetical protein n=1 Tax=Marinicellulosiphila megalodicopiae TaxID=2724896 RepID=UPI003BAEFC16
MKRKIIPIIVSSATMAISGQSFAEINMNGFATMVAGQSLTEDKELHGYDEKLRFEKGSNLGLQFSSDLGEGVTATAQLMTRGENDWSIEAEWAYISYEVNDSIKLIAGKQRSPFYMYSDYVDVGYAYHWLTPPENVYALPFDSSNGISMIMSNYFGDLDSTLQVMFGRTQKDGFSLSGNDADLDSYNSFTFNWTGVYDFATFRLGHSMAKIDIGLAPMKQIADGWQAYDDASAFEADELIKQINVNEDPVSFSGLGLTLDFDTYFVVAEYTLLNLSESFIGKSQSYYISAGYRFDNFTAHVTYGGDSSTANETIQEQLDEIDSTYAGAGVDAAYQGLKAGTEQLADAEADSTDISAGLRWDFHPATAFKFDLTQRTDNLLDEDNSALIYRAALTTVF